MKNIKQLRILVIVSLFFTLFSCTTEPVIHTSKITNFPLLSIKGSATVFIPAGGTYTDPGAVATEGGAVITTTSKISGVYRNGTTLDTNVPDHYIQTYTAVNVDGFSATATRDIWVYKTGNLTNSLEGIYLSTVRRNGSLLPASQGSSVDMKYVLIWKNANGTFEISDAFGGWYDLGRKIGVASATQHGTIAGDVATNSYTFPGNPLTNVYFGGVAKLTSVVATPATKTVVVGTSWDAGPYAFVSTLTQVQP